MAQNSLMSPGKTDMFKIILVFDRKFKFLEKQIMKIKKNRCYFIVIIFLHFAKNESSANDQSWQIEFK